MKRNTRRLLTAGSVLALATAGLSGFMVGLAQAAHPGSALLGLAQVAARSVVPAGPAQNAGSGGGPSETAATTAAGRAGSAPALSGSTAGPVTSGASGGQTQHDPARAGGAAQERIHACGGVPTGFARCHAILTRPAGKPTFVGTVPAGYNPADLHSAYKLPSTSAGTGLTVAIVDAFDDPGAESDLAVYRSQFSLPACTTANGCFRKVAQDGSTNFPAANGAWAQEISLDVDMVSAVCPNCHIILVEANTASLTDLLTAVDEAAALGASVISNSYGAAEFSGETSFDGHLNHPGVAITASSGDSGFGVQYPAASQYVTAVGGTSLTPSRDPANARGWSETAWSGAGSGCSAFEPSPSWQASNPNVAGACPERATADVSAVADPGTGVAVYDSFKFHGAKGWLVFGGTSVSSPIIASVFALGVATPSPASYPYAHSSSLFDITSGSNGTCGSILCNAAPGWDGPTGLGTPDGAGGF